MLLLSLLLLLFSLSLKQHQTQISEMAETRLHGPSLTINHIIGTRSRVVVAQSVSARTSFFLSLFFYNTALPRTVDVQMVPPMMTGRVSKDERSQELLALHRQFERMCRALGYLFPYMRSNGSQRNQ